MVRTKDTKRIPDLRFSEFEGAWIDSKLGDQVDRISSGKDKPEKKGKFDVYGSTGIIGKSHIFSHKGKYLLIARVGANAGRINYVEGEFSVTDNTLVIYAKEVIDLNFTNAALLNFNLNRLVFGTGQPLITGGQLKSLRLYFPTLPEQEKIASFLSAVDKKIEHLARGKELLEQYKKGVMQKIFNRDIRFKDDNGNDYPDWQEKELGKLGRINPKTSELPYKFVYIDLESVAKGRLLKEEIVFSEDAPSRAQRVMTKGDILFQMVRPYQKNNLFFNLEGDYVASTGYAQIRAKGDPTFLYQLLHYQPLVNLVIRSSTGSNYPAINSTDLNAITAKVPSICEQEKIGAFLQNIDNKIESVQSKLTQTQTFKKGLLQQMFV